MHSDWFNGIEILKCRWHHGEKVGYSYPSGLEKTRCKWDILINVPLLIIEMLLCSVAHCIVCTRLFRGKMRSDWFNGIEILQGRWHHGEKVGYSYPSGLEKTLYKWEIHVSLVTKGLTFASLLLLVIPSGHYNFPMKDFLCMFHTFLTCKEVRPAHLLTLESLN